MSKFEYAGSAAYNKTVKGMRKQPQFEDLMKVELENTRRVIHLPARYIFQAEHAVATSGDLDRALQEQHVRVRAVVQADMDDGDRAVPIAAARVQRGDTGMRGETGAKGETGPAGPAGVPGPPGASSAQVDLGPVLAQMQSRLDAREAEKERARDKELQDQLALMRMEAQRHAEMARVLAQQQANLTSIPDEVRAMAAASSAAAAASSATQQSYLQEAMARAAARERDNHESHMAFLQRNASGIASVMGQMGTGIAQAIQQFRPPERDIQVTPSQPRPPPPPGGDRIRIAAEEAIRPPKRPTNPPGGPNC